MAAKQYYVYIMANKQHTVLYTGMTDNLAKRVWQHKQRLIEGFTKRYNVVKLVYYEVFGDCLSALRREKQIKAGSRKKKEELINSINKQWVDLYDKLWDFIVGSFKGYELASSLTTGFTIKKGIAASAAKRPPRNYTNPTAFTLVELLIIIAIILSITAITLPALQLARSHTKAVVCGANLGRLCSAMAAYESMNETLPYGFNVRKDVPPGGFPGGSSDKPGWWWFNYIDVYSGDAVGKPSIVKCPAKHLTDRRRQLITLSGNYGANLSLCKEGGTTDAEFKGMPLSRSEVKDKSRTMLLVDSGYATIKWQHAAKKPPEALTNKIQDTAAYIPGLSINSQRQIFPGQETDAINGRHPNKTVNVGFVDGHVSRVKAEELLTDSKGDTSENSDVKWKPK